MKNKMRINDLATRTRLNRNQMGAVNGGIRIPICIEGVLDGIKGNTKVKIGKCH